MKFTWDSNKAEKVKVDHKVDFADLFDVFKDPFAVEFTDEDHSTEDEIRFAIIGVTPKYGLIYLVFTEISESHLHFITARKAENWMIKEYDKNRSRI